MSRDERTVTGKAANDVSQESGESFPRSLLGCQEYRLKPNSALQGTTVKIRTEEPCASIDLDTPAGVVIVNHRVENRVAGEVSL